MSWTAFGLFPLRTLGSSETKRFICPSASLRTLVQSWAEPGAHSAGGVTAGFSAVGKSEGTGPDGCEEGMPVAGLVSLTGVASRALLELRRPVTCGVRARAGGISRAGECKLCHLTQRAGRKPPHELTGRPGRELVKPDQAAAALLECQVSAAARADEPGGELAQVGFVPDYENALAIGMLAQEPEQGLG